MRNLKTTGMFIFSAVLLLSACENKNLDKQSIEGTYKGTLHFLETSDKSTNSNDFTLSKANEATAEVTVLDDNTIEVHCFGDGMDTTFMLNFYDHHDSVYVCLTGSDFEEMYGHMPGDGHMGGMMDDMHDDETEWMHHMRDEHHEGDEHFGGFDMNGHTFTYRFRMMNSDSIYYKNFHGTKQ